MRITLIVAMAENHVIGRDNQLPWRIPDDLRRFKRLTLGHVVIMGRKTYESLGKPLPERLNVVLTRDPAYPIPEGVHTAPNLDAALTLARNRNENEAFVIGGGEIFREALPHADTIRLTLVHANIPGDATFPPIDPKTWKETAREEREQTEPQPLKYAFIDLERRRDQNA